MELQKYTNWLKRKDYSPHTLRNYAIALKQYGKYKLTVASLRNHFQQLLPKLQANTCLMKFRALVSYSKYKKIKVNWDRIKSLLPKIEPKFFITISHSELEQLKATRTEINDWTHQRNNLMLDFLFYTGIRVNELVNIRHADYQGQALRILGKGNKIRYVFVPPFLQEKLNPYSSNYLFTNSQGQKLTDNRIWYIVKEKLVKSGIRKIISPHTFRRSFATLLNSRKCNLTTIQKLLGHSNIQTTAAYIHNDYDTLYQDYSKLWKSENASASSPL